MHIRAVAAGSILAVAAACGVDSREGGAQPGQSPASASHYILAETPLLSIGGPDERPGHQLTYPEAALQLSDGHVVVAEALDRSLRYFDAEGNLAVTAGGAGDGPGEFRGFTSIGRFAGDTISVWDAGHLRVQLFDRDASLADAITVSAWPEVAQHLMGGSPASRVTAHEAVVLANRHVVVKPMFQPMLNATGLVPFRVPLIVFGADGESWSEVGSFPAVEEWFLAEGVASQPAFGDRAHMVGGRAGVYIGSRRNRMIGNLVPGDSALTTFGLGIEPRAVTAEHVQAVRKARLDRASPSLEENVATFVDAMPVPDSMPFLSGLRRDAGGGVWVQEYVPRTDLDQRWIAFDATGASVATVTMEADLEVMDLGEGYAIVLTTDELDVPEIRMHALVPVEGGS